MSRRLLNNYQKVQAQTASPAQRVVMVYQGIVKNLQQADDAFDLDNPLKFEIIHNSVSLANQLILELKLAIDMENGGELAKKLDALYDFYRDSLTKANLQKNRTPIQEAMHWAKEMADAWEKASQQSLG